MNIDEIRENQLLRFGNVSDRPVRIVKGWGDGD